MLLERWHWQDLLNAGLLQTFNLFKKKALFAKCNKAKWIKMRHTYLYLKKDRYSTKTIFYQYYDLVFPLDAWLACELLRTRTLFAKHGKVCEYWHVEWTFSSSIDTVNNRNKAFNVTLLPKVQKRCTLFLPYWTHYHLVISKRAYGENINLLSCLIPWTQTPSISLLMLYLLTSSWEILE